MEAVQCWQPKYGLTWDVYIYVVHIIAFDEQKLFFPTFY